MKSTPPLTALVLAETAGVLLSGRMQIMAPYKCQAADALQSCTLLYTAEAANGQKTSSQRSSKRLAGAAECAAPASEWPHFRWLGHECPTRWCCHACMPCLWACLILVPAAETKRGKQAGGALVGVDEALQHARFQPLHDSIGSHAAAVMPVCFACASAQCHWPCKDRVRRASRRRACGRR